MLSSTNASAPITAGAARPLQEQVRAQAPSAPPTAPDPRANPHSDHHPAPADLEKALKTLNEFTAMVARDVRFTIDEESGKAIVKVVDTATEEVLRQFPSAEALAIAHSIDKMQGLLIREKA